MRKRCLLAFTFCFSLLSLCACGGVLPRTATLSPFSADLSFEQNGTVFEGAFLMENADTMQFILRTPQELCGLQFSFEAGEAALRFGEAAVSLADACALSLPTAAPCALFEALCALAASRPQQKSLRRRRGRAVLCGCRSARGNADFTRNGDGRLFAGIAFAAARAARRCGFHVRKHRADCHLIFPLT